MTSHDRCLYAMQTLTFFWPFLLCLEATLDSFLDIIVRLVEAN